jgi:hypothetical protein
VMASVRFAAGVYSALTTDRRLLCFCVLFISNSTAPR